MLFPNHPFARKPRAFESLSSQGGEDLRLDQRIEQLFVVMNGILSQSAPTARRGLKIGTYKVIPMTGSVGMIEWVRNTRPLKVSA